MYARSVVRSGVLGLSCSVVAFGSLSRMVHRPPAILGVVRCGMLGESDLADREAIRSEIRRLVREGHVLYGAELMVHTPKAEREKATRALTKVKNDLSSEVDGDSQVELVSTLDGLLKNPDFPSEYQSWYSPALRVVQQLLPDRYSEFCDLYKPSRRKETDIETYGIADYIGKLRILRYDGKEAFDARLIALSKFNQQIAIVGTAEGRLDSVLSDISRTLHAEILDNELDAARNLLAASHLRSAGVVAGVVLEGHLKKLIQDHAVTFRKKAMLSNMNDALKEAGVYDAAQWRQIQYLTDIRNLCGHKNERDPSREEVDSLISGVAKITKTLF
jgi:hypothetical protein